MDKLKHDFRLKWWPSLQDYNEAIQNPHINLQDAELKQGEAYTTPLGLPRAVTGSFASVYRMHCGDVDYALRLFLKNIEDQSERYALISDFVQHDDLPYTVTFGFLANGIKMRGDWFPALKMQWVEGEPFDDYIVENLSRPKKLRELADKFLKMMIDLRQAGIAHGDLQHGNIIISRQEIRLVDYDGMFVPAMKGFLASECGHRNYQHPARAPNHFGPYLDNFSAWIIYASLRALEVDAKLFAQLAGGDDCLLFRQQDFKEPTNSPAFAALEKHENRDLNALGRFIRSQLDRDVTQIPYLQWPLPKDEQPDVEPLSQSAATTRSGPRLVRPGLSEWLQLGNLQELAKQGQPPGQTPGQTPGQKIQDPYVVYAKPIQASTWVKPALSKTGATGKKDTDNFTLNPFKNLGILRSTKSPQNVQFKLSSVTGGISPPLNYQFLPQELVATMIPRRVKFNSALIPRGICPPSIYQLCMLINPFFWSMLFFFFAAYTSDKDLCDQAARYEAVVKHFSFYKHSDKYGTTINAVVDFHYEVNGADFVVKKDVGPYLSRYELGEVVPIWAIPSEPTKHAPIGESPFEKQKNDLRVAWLTLILNLGLECWIWWHPILQRRLARSGTPVLAKITELYRDRKAFFNYATMTFQYRGKTRTQRIRISDDSYYILNTGTQQVILCDPILPFNTVLYRDCAYHPINTSKP